MRPSRTHCAPNADPITLHDVEQGGLLKANGKPRGFWYEVDGDWQRWSQDAEVTDQAPSWITARQLLTAPTGERSDG